MGIIKEIDKGNGEFVRVEISEFKGKHYLNLRIWYTDKNSGELRPSPKGVAVKLELYPEIKEAILMAENEVNQLLSATPTPSGETDRPAE